MCTCEPNPPPHTRLQRQYGKILEGILVRHGIPLYNHTLTLSHTQTQTHTLVSLSLSHTNTHTNTLKHKHTHTHTLISLSHTHTQTHTHTLVQCPGTSYGRQPLCSWQIFSAWLAWGPPPQSQSAPGRPTAASRPPVGWPSYLTQHEVREEGGRCSLLPATCHRTVQWLHGELGVRRQPLKHSATGNRGRTTSHTVHACVQLTDDSHNSPLAHLRELSLTTKGDTFLTSSSDSRWNMASWSGIFIPAVMKHYMTSAVTRQTFHSSEQHTRAYVCQRCRNG